MCSLNGRQSVIVLSKTFIELFIELIDNDLQQLSFITSRARRFSCI
jgi:hypothetical protein